MDKKELWLRLYHYHFEHLVPASLWDLVRARFGGADASTRAFADKLGRKLGWKHRYACRALAEYKKFVYLGLVSDFVVTPSKAIDQVWHEHLLFTRAYRSFCTDVIGHPFEHEPELTPMAGQTAVFRAQYHDTLALYRCEFGFEPPADIWFDPKFETGEGGDLGRSQKKRRPVCTDPEWGFEGATWEADPTPLHQSFEGDAGAFSPDGFDFAGGDGGGAGASGDWGDTGSEGGDSNGGDSSCSSCSSGGGGGD